MTMKTKRIMRRILSGALAAATVCGSAFAYANPAAESTQTTTSVSASAVEYAETASAVYMRSEPQNGAAIVCTIPENTTIQKVSQNGNWYQVSYNGKTGYIYKKFLKQTGETAAPAQQPQETTSTPAQKEDKPQETTGTVYTTAGVNMRTQPKNGSAVICVVPQGTQVQKTGTSGNWVQISYNNQTGYVYNKYLSDKSTGAAQNTTQPSNTTDNTTTNTTTTTKGEEFSDVLGSKTTYYNSSVKGRTTNIRLAAEAIDGTVLQPGETFSLNGIVGRRTAAKGYQNAIIFQNGKQVEGLGGGVCQVSSTVYGAVLYADLKVTERSCHQFQVSYTPVSQDAAVYYGSQDFKFVNNTDNPIKIVASAGSGSLSVTIYGTKTSEKTVTLSSKSSVSGNYKYASLYKTVTENGKSTTTKVNTSKYLLK